MGLASRNPLPVLRRRVKPIAGGLLLLAAALGASVAVAQRAVPAERLGRLAAARAADALDRDVSVTGVRLSLLPRPALTLEGVVVGGGSTGQDDVSATAPLATAGRIRLEPRLLPLLRRRVVLDGVVAESLALLIEVDGEGRTNLPDIASAGAEGSQPGLDLRRLVVRDGTLVYRDRRSRTVVRATGIRQRLRLHVDPPGGGSLEVRGHSSARAVSAEGPGPLPRALHGLPAKVDHTFRLDRERDALVLERLILEPGPARIDVRGVVGGLSRDTRELDLRIAAGSLPLHDLVELLLPDGGGVRMPEGGELEVAKGSVRVIARVSGPWGPGVRPDVEASLELEGASLALDGTEIVTRLSGPVEVSGQGWRSGELTGRLLGEALRAGFEAPAGTGPAVVRLRSRVDLSRAREVGLLPAGLRADGRVSLDVQGHGAPGEPLHRAGVTGVARLEGVRVEGSAGAGGVDLEGAVELVGREARASGLRMRVGGQEATVEGQLSEWLPAVLGAGGARPHLRLAVRAPSFELEPWLFGDGPTYGSSLRARLAGEEAPGTALTELASRAGVRLPHGLAMNARLTVGEVRGEAWTLQGLELDLAGRSGELELAGGRFRLVGGDLDLAAALDAPLLRDGRLAYPLTVTGSLADVDAEALLAGAASLRGRVAGSLSARGEARALLDAGLLPLPETLGGAGTYTLTDGRLMGWPALSAAARVLRVPMLDPLEVERWAGEFRIEGPRVHLSPARIDPGPWALDVGGSFGLDGDLALETALRVPPGSWPGDRPPGQVAGLLVAAAAGADGRVPVGVRVRGPFEAPDLDVHLTEAARNVEASLARKALDAAVGALRGSAGRDPLPGAHPQPGSAPDGERAGSGEGDSHSADAPQRSAVGARERVEHAVRESLRQLLR